MTAPLHPTTASDGEDGVTRRLRAAAEDPMWADHCEIRKATVREAATLINQLSAEVAAKDAVIEKLNSRLAFALDEGTSWAVKAGEFSRRATAAEAEATGLRADLTASEAREKALRAGFDEIARAAHSIDKTIKRGALPRMEP